MGAQYGWRVGGCPVGGGSADSLLLWPFFYLFPADELYRHTCGDGHPLWSAVGGTLSFAGHLAGSDSPTIE